MIIVKELMTKMYRSLAIYFYKKWGENIIYDRNPVGIPNQRDPESECEYYTPHKNKTLKPVCQGDGHYLCSNCKYFSKEDL